MKKMDRKAIDDHLDRLGVVEGRNLVVHARLIALGMCRVEDILSALQARIGPTATLVVPTYVFGLHDFYDPDRTKPTGMGALSTLVWHHDGAVRSFNPVHNHAGLGPLAAELRKTSMLASFGEDTDFAWMHDRDFDLLLLGCGFGKAGTFLHHMETLANVPYRAWVKSPKRILIDGQIRDVPFQYFARQDGNWVEDFDRILPVLGDLPRTASAPYGSSILVSLKELARVGMGLLSEDPYALVSAAEAPVP